MLEDFPLILSKRYLSDLKTTHNFFGLMIGRMTRLYPTHKASKYPFSVFLMEKYGTRTPPKDWISKGIYEEYFKWKSEKPKEDLLTEYGQCFFLWWSESAEGKHVYFENLMWLYQEFLTNKVKEGHRLIKNGRLTLSWDFEELIRVRDHIYNMNRVLHVSEWNSGGMWGIDDTLARQENWIDVGLWALLKNQGVRVSAFQNTYYKAIDEGHSCWWTQELTDTPPLLEEEIKETNENQTLSDFLLN